MCAFGKGTYIAKNASYSKDYAMNSSDDISFMLFCKLVYSSLVNLKKTKTHSGPAIGQVFVDNASDPSIFAVPDDGAVIPLYVVAFYKKAPR